MINPNKEFTRITYVACHAENFGGGHFSDMPFKTPEEAKNFIDSRDATCGEEHKEYWYNIKVNMFIMKKTSNFEPYNSTKILPINQVKNIVETHTNLNLKNTNVSELMVIINTIKIMKLEKGDRDIVSNFADMVKEKSL